MTGFYNVFRYPDLSNQGTTTVITLDDNTAGNEHIISWIWQPLVATAVKTLRISTANRVGNPGSLTAVISARTAGQWHPPMDGSSPDEPTDIGSGGTATKQSTATSSGWSNNGTFDLDFANAFTPTVGTKYFISIYVTPGETCDASNDLAVKIAHQSFDGVSPDISIDTTNGFSTLVNNDFSTRHPNYMLLDSSGDPVRGMYSIYNSGNTITYNSTDTPDEYGNKFWLPDNFQAELVGYHYQQRVINTSDDQGLRGIVRVDGTVQTEKPERDATEFDYRTNAYFHVDVVLATPIDLSSASTFSVGLQALDTTDSRIVKSNFAGSLSSADDTRSLLNMPYQGYSAKSQGVTSEFDDAPHVAPILHIKDQLSGGGGSASGARNPLQGPIG